RVGTRMRVLIDETDEEGAVARSYLDAPEIDGNVFIDADSDGGFEGLAPGEMVEVEIEEAAEYDLWGRLI
ncbi:MAG: 30S ribosomal protein S12 methylthiotransferase RimO, partial [Pseudomonadota bacterium]